MKLKRLLVLTVIISFLVGSASVVFVYGGLEVDPKPWAIVEIE